MRKNQTMILLWVVMTDEVMASIQVVRLSIENGSRLINEGLVSYKEVYRSRGNA